MSARLPLSDVSSISSPPIRQHYLMNCSVPTKSMAMLFDGPLSTIVITLGVLGNAYCLRVLFSRSITTSMLVSLTGLAIWDMVLLLASFFHYSMWSSLYYVGLTDYPWNPHLIALNGLVECGHITATWMLIEVTAERFFAVTRPFHFSTIHRKQRRKSYAKLIAGYIRLPLIMTLVACIITLPCSFEYGIEPCLHNGERRFQRHKTPLLNNPYYRVFYRMIFLSVTKTFGPFIIITLLTVSTVKSMRKSMNSRASILMQQGKDHLFKADRDKTKSLQTISVLLLAKFLLLRCWPTLIAITQVIFGEIPSTPLHVDISQFFLLLNSATNSFVFVILKIAFETRRLKRIRMRQRELVAKHAEQVLSIGKAIASDKLLLLREMETEQNPFLK